MSVQPAKIALQDWDEQYQRLVAAGMTESAFGGCLSRHLEEGDYRLRSLEFDNSPAALALWNLLLTEEARLRQARAAGHTLVGAMKDLGTVPVMAFALPNVTAFYPDGAWWIPCIMEMSDHLLQAADRMGIDESFCPVRAMLGAFESQAHFPIPDLLFCSVGATCDDFSAIAQRLEAMGHPITWWEIPHRRQPQAGENAVVLPGGCMAPVRQVEFVRGELERIRVCLSEAAGIDLTDALLQDSIHHANRVRSVLDALRSSVFNAPICPMPALEMLIVEMLAIHYCSDRDATLRVLEALYSEVSGRIQAQAGVLAADAARIFWVNPVADLRAMNLLETCGGRVCGTELLFSHALDRIPEDLPPMEALARTALADPMAGPASERAARIVADMKRFNAEAVIISRIPGASHCAWEGQVIREMVHRESGLPVLELEIPPVCDAMLPTLETRMRALIETVMERRQG